MESTLRGPDIEHNHILRASIAEKPEVQARVLESMAEGVVLTDNDGIISYTNPAFEKMFGYEAGELNGRHVFILNGGSQPELEQQFLEITRHLERNNVWSGEYFNRRKDGAFFYTQAHISTLELSGQRYFISVQEDITERKRMDGELLQQRTILEKRVAERTDQLEKHRLELEANNRKLQETHHQLEISHGRYSGDFAPLGYVSIDNKGVVRDINVTGARMLGVDRACLVGTPFVFFVSKKDGRLFFNHMQRCKQALRQVTTELDMGMKSGNRFPAQLSSVPVYDAEGGETLYRTAIIDITERRQAEERIGRLNRLYQVLSETGKAIVRATDSEELFRNICRIVVRHGGFRMAWVGLIDAESGLVRPVTASGVGVDYLRNIRITVSEEPEGLGPVGSAIRDGNFYVSNDFINSPRTAPWNEEGEKRGFLASTAFALKRGGKVIGALTMYAEERDFFDTQLVELLNQMAADISFALDNLDREARRREAEKKYRDLFEESKDVIYIMDADGRLVDVNPAGSELFGYSKEELRALDIARDLYCDAQERPRFHQKLNARGYVRDYELQFKKKNGKELSVLVSASVIRDEEGNLAGYRGIIHDVTKRKQLEQQLLQAQKMESIGLLAGGVAHDFNNLLTAINGYGQIIQENFAANNEMLGMCIGQIMSAAARATELTRSLLAFGRKQIMNPKPVFIDDIVINLKKLLARLIGEDIDLTTSHAGGYLTVLADSGQIDQVLINLVTNARDAMPSGGKLHIRTERVELDKKTALRCDLEKGGAYALIAVTDNGKGMDKQTQKRIFEPFFTTKETGKGTGLGLSINYGIVKQHNGAITVKSELGQGTVVSVYLPLVEAAVGISLKPKVPSLPHGTETILVAEDDVIVSKFMRTVLEMAGYTVITALNGAEAIEKFRENRDTIDLVLCDVVMPEKNGKEVCEEIRTIKPHAKLIFISGYNDEIINTKGILLENTEFLTKPISKQRLLLKLREILEPQAE